MKNKTGSQDAGSQAGWKRWIRLALLLLWMAVIFSFSAQNGTRSAANSLPLAELLQLPEWVIRKGAHMAEYAVLAVLALGFLDTFSLSGKKAAAFAWLFSAVYAASDEFHQMLSAGRSASLKDICIDGAGAALGLAAVCLIRALRGRRSARIHNGNDKKEGRK